MQKPRISPFDRPDPAPDFIRGEVVEVRTVQDALRLLDQWEQAYAELRTDYARAWNELEKAKVEIDNLEALRRHLDPYLPRWLQDEAAREAAPVLYEQLAQYRRDDYTV